MNEMVKLHDGKILIYGCNGFEVFDMDLYSLVEVEGKSKIKKYKHIINKVKTTSRETR
jgi:hypothetical protein